LFDFFVRYCVDYMNEVNPSSLLAELLNVITKWLDGVSVRIDLACQIRFNHVLDLMQYDDET
jgi:hypothetical protein